MKNKRQKINLVLRILDNLFEENKPTKETNELLVNGAVWHGDWLNDTDEGIFGVDMNKQHFAMILWDKKVHYKPGVRLAPITSKKKNRRRAVFLPKGELKTTRPKAGWILPRIKLIIRKSEIESKFNFKQMLCDKYVKQCREVLQNG